MVLPFLPLLDFPLLGYAAGWWRCLLLISDVTLALWNTTAGAADSSCHYGSNLSPLIRPQQEATISSKDTSQLLVTWSLLHTYMLHGGSS